MNVDRDEYHLSHHRGPDAGAGAPTVSAGTNSALDKDFASSPRNTSASPLPKKRRRSCKEHDLGEQASNGRSSFTFPRCAVNPAGTLPASSIELELLAMQMAARAAIARQQAQQVALQVAAGFAAYPILGGRPLGKASLLHCIPVSETASVNQPRAVYSEGVAKLHSVCKEHPENVSLVAMLLRSYPDGAAEPVFQAAKDGCRVNGKKSKFLSSLCSYPSTIMPVPERGSYPLHLALRNGASLGTVQLLLTAAPSVLLERDAHGRVPLTVALQHRCEDEIVRTLLFGDRKATQAIDRRYNLPLHFACVHGYGLQVIKWLLEGCEATIHRKNFDGMTPLDLAIHCFGEDMKMEGRVVAYLQKMSLGVER